MTTTTAHQDHGAVIAAQHGIERSPHWPVVEKAHLKLQPYCVACKPGTNITAGLQVHHIFPFHYCIALGRPDLELDLRNLITLCEHEESRPGDNHHLLIGHLDDFKSSNLVALEDAENTFFGMSAADIKQSKVWLDKKQSRLKPLEQMTQQEKDDFTALMNKTFPKI